MNAQFSPASIRPESVAFLLRRWWLLAALAAVLAATMLGKPTHAQESGPDDSIATRTTSEATLIYLNRPIVTFRATIGSFTPDERAVRAHRRLVELERSKLAKPIELTPVELAGVQGLLLTIDGQPLFGIAPADVDREQIASVATLAEDARSRLADAFAARIEQERLPVLLWGMGWSTAGFIVLSGLIWLVWKLRLRVSERFHSLVSERVKKATAPKFDWTRYGYALTARLVQLATTFVALLLIYLWLSFSLAQFPITEPLANRLNAFLIELVVGLAAKATEALPGLVTAIVILLIAQALVQVVTNVISAAEGGRVTLPMIKPDTASATRRIVRILIWGIGFAIAYPYIPGSDSAAFQGLSVLFGLMITLGSTGIVSQMMSGTVLVYSRALHPGEFVSTGDVEGVVSEMGAISTKLLTVRNEEITIPNSVLVDSTIKNYSRQFGGRSAQLSTKITIGYDTPWRQVHAMLLMAAANVDGLRTAPKPYVVQRSLTDFYVEYELFALTDRPRDQLAILSALHSRIQDVFNEYGVQIMSPQYYEQPPQPLIVPKDKWFTAPARADQDVASVSTEAVTTS
jgi:small-conductance mechanosensitive channel